MNRMTAIRMLTTAKGSPWVICRISPIELMTANRKDIVTIPLALLRASQDTRKPMNPYPGDSSDTNRPWMAATSAIPAKPATPPATNITTRI